MQKWGPLFQEFGQAGDVTGGIMLAHVASREGEVAAENAARVNSTHGLQSGTGLHLYDA